MREGGEGQDGLGARDAGTKGCVWGVYVRQDLELIALGYALLPDYEGQGCARESSKRVMQAAKAHFGQSKLSAITHRENTASIRVLETLGFKHKGQKFVSGYDGPSEYFEVTL
mgnify:CR=1 FL=1